jgi:MFS family permease
MPEAPSAATSYRRLFRNGAFLRVFTAGLGSVAGSSIATVCIVWIVFIATGSALDVALVAVSAMAGNILFSVFGGTLVDRYDRRRLMVLSDAVRAVALAAIVVVFAVRGFNLPALLGASFVVGALTVLFNPAEQAILPSLVAADTLADANGLVRSSRSALMFVGASVGGVLIVTVGALSGLAVNAATFAVSAALLVGLRTSAPAVPSRLLPPGSYFRDLRAGFAWLWQATGFLELTFSATFFNFCSSLVATFLVFFATDVLHGSAFVYALLLAVEVGGNGVGALLVGRTGAVRWAGRAWTIPYGIVSGTVALVLVLVPAVPVAVAALFALGVLGGFAGTAWLSAAQLLVPPELQGRYFGIDNLGSVAIIPAAQIGGAFLILALGVREAYLVTAVLWVVAGAAFLVPRALWNLGVRPERTDHVP